MGKVTDLLRRNQRCKRRYLIANFLLIGWSVCAPAGGLAEPRVLRVGVVDGSQPCSYREAGVWSCLLYTSPSPRDRTRSRMPSSA